MSNRACGGRNDHIASGEARRKWRRRRRRWASRPAKLGSRRRERRDGGGGMRPHRAPAAATLAVRVRARLARRAANGRRGGTSARFAVSEGSLSVGFSVRVLLNVCCDRLKG